VISLYFNCFITENKIDQLSHGDRGFFYPVSYPRPLTVESISQIDILIKVIKSYSNIEFDVVIFNLDIPFATEEIRTKIKSLISKSFTYNKVYIFFERPSTILDWTKDIAKYQNVFKPESPLLVVMNHDHPFVDYTTSSIQKIVKQVFPSLQNNFGKVLCYSHAPEFISNAVNDIDFYEISPCLYRKDHINNWVDSICFMTSETLMHIWNNLIFDGKYIGRFDWPESRFKSLDVSMYIHTREYFRHYDSYGHTTGMRLFSEFQCNSNYPINTPSFINRDAMVNFYYQKWIDCFLLTVRDYMIKNRFSLKPKKKLFIQIVEKTIVMFKISYLKLDLQEKILNEKDVIFLENAIVNQIYYNSNIIFSEISTDIKLLEPGTIKKIVLFTINFFKIIIVFKKIKKWIS
jgi:hypothetical protein